MQQPAQQPPVAMYVVHYVQPNQGQQPQGHQQMVVPSPQMLQQHQPVQPQMWGSFPQGGPLNGMPMQMIPYPQYMSFQQAQAMQAQMMCVPRSGVQPQHPPAGQTSAQNAQHPSSAQPRSIPGPVQPLKATSLSPGPPAGGATLVKCEPNTSSLADFATVASMQRVDTGEFSGAKRKRGQGSPGGSPGATNDINDTTSSPGSLDGSPSNQLEHEISGKRYRRYKKRNFPVEVEICLPRTKAKTEGEGEDGSNGDVNPTEPSPQDASKPVIQFVPGLPETPRAVMDPVRVPELEAEGATTNSSPQDPQDEMDEDVMWMEDDDPTKRRKRSANVFDEVLTMNPQYTPEGFVCPECHKIFKFRKHCRRHMVNHSGSKPFKCPKCPRSYTRKDTCQRHAAACRFKGTVTDIRGIQYIWDENDVNNEPSSNSNGLNAVGVAKEG